MEQNLISMVDDATFDDFVAKADKPILLAVGASWCPDCQRIRPFFMKFAQNFADKLIFASADFDTSPNLKSRFDIQKIPTLFVIREGKVVDTLIEPKEIALFKAFVEKALAQ
ncbi:MAG TPA: thiol reductase thioredoxin [Sutterella sp.]|nr:thiol reductase thioredoxin [Sutterella sp.]